MKKFLVVLITVVMLVGTVPIAKAAVSMCDLANWCHWCPAYAMGCIWEIIYSYTGANAPDNESYASADADGLSG